MGEVGWCSRDFSQCTPSDYAGDKQLRGEDGDYTELPHFLWTLPLHHSPLHPKILSLTPCGCHQNQGGRAFSSFKWWVLPSWTKTRALRRGLCQACLFWSQP